VSQSEAEQFFFSAPLLMLQDTKHSQGEPRFHALGKTESGRLLHITFTTRAEGKEDTSYFRPRYESKRKNNL
jgi:uncharacterized protein